LLECLLIAIDNIHNPSFFNLLLTICVKGINASRSLHQNKHLRASGKGIARMYIVVHGEVLSLRMIIRLAAIPVLSDSLLVVAADFAHS
jgi:hypothetical protein